MQTQALPAAVRRQIEAGNRAAEKVLAQKPATPAVAQNANSKPTNPAPTPAPAAATATPPVATPAPAPASAAPQPSPAPAPASAPAGANDFEQKYRVLQGKYNAEVPRLQQQTQAQQLQIQQLNDQLLSTQALIASLGQPRSATAQQAAPAKRIKEDEVKEFGADLTDFIQRAALDAVLPEVEARVSRVARPIAEKVEQTTKVLQHTAARQAQTDEQRVMAQLAQDVPQWEQLDTDQGFLDWLDQVDPFSGVKRGDLLTQAFQSHNAPRVVAFFKSYLSEHAAVTPPANSGTPAAPANGAPQVDLNSLVAPGTPKGAAGTQAGTEKRIWTASDIKQFYRAKQTGFFKTPEQQAQAKLYEQDIFAAQREGRVRP